VGGIAVDLFIRRVKDRVSVIAEAMDERESSQLNEIPAMDVSTNPIVLTEVVCKVGSQRIVDLVGEHIDGIECQLAFNPSVEECTGKRSNSGPGIQ
jgi:hypothetical protein